MHKPKTNEQVLHETNINDLIVRTHNAVFSQIVRFINSKVKDIAAPYAAPGETFRTGDDLHDFATKQREAIPGMVSEMFLKMEATFQRLAQDYLGSLMNTMTTKGSVDYSPWATDRIVVWIEDNGGTDAGSGGAFMYTRDNMINLGVPSRLMSTIPPNTNAVCIHMHCSFAYTATALDRALEASVDSGELIPLRLDHTQTASEDFVAQLVNLLDTLLHEYTHLQQWAKQLKTDTSSSKFASAEKHYAKPSTLHAFQIASSDIMKWGPKEWTGYLSSAIEIDAHAVSVASTIIMQCRKTSGDLEEEYSNIVFAIKDLSHGYTTAKSLDMYDNIRRYTPDPEEFKRVYQRFMKKVGAQLVAYADQLLHQIKA